MVDIEDNFMNLLLRTVDDEDRSHLREMGQAVAVAQRLGHPSIGSLRPVREGIMFAVDVDWMPLGTQNTELLDVDELFEHLTIGNFVLELDGPMVRVRDFLLWHGCKMNTPADRDHGSAYGGAFEK